MSSSSSSRVVPAAPAAPTAPAVPTTRRGRKAAGDTTKKTKKKTPEDTSSTAEDIAKPARVAKPRLSFMLHDPVTFASLGKFVSTDPRYAALKTASRGVKDIRLRKTNTKLVYHYTGCIIDLDTPQVVKRGEREITYSKKPSVKFVSKYVYDGALPDDEQEEDGEVSAKIIKPSAPAAAAST